MKIESKRLILRTMEEADFPSLSRMLKDREVMHAWEKTFSDREICDWIARQQKREAMGEGGYLLAVDRQTGEAVGQIGPLLEEIQGEKVWGIGYILCREHWGKGYALEGARAVARYLFEEVGALKIVCDIRPFNLRSIRVARALGMEETGSFVKIYDGKEMPHLIFTLKREDFSPAEG